MVRRATERHRGGEGAAYDHPEAEGIVCIPHSSISPFVRVAPIRLTAGSRGCVRFFTMHKPCVVIRIVPSTWPSVCTVAYPNGCFTFGLSCNLQAAEAAAAKRQPPETRNKVGRPKTRPPSPERVEEAVAAMEEACNTDSLPSFLDDLQASQPAAVVPDTPVMQRLDTQVIAHSVTPSHVLCI